jgi:hypothetical protein
VEEIKKVICLNCCHIRGQRDDRFYFLIFGINLNLSSYGFKYNFREVKLWRVKESSISLGISPPDFCGGLNLRPLQVVLSLVTSVQKQIQNYLAGKVMEPLKVWESWKHTFFRKTLNKKPEKMYQKII